MRASKYPILIVITLLLLARSVAADMFLYDKKHVRTLLVCAHAVDCKHAESVFKIARDYIEESVNVSLDLVKVESIPEDMSGNIEVRLLKWQLRVEKLQEELKVGATIVFLSPFPLSLDNIDFQTEDVFGIVNDIGILGDNAATALVRMAGSDKVISRIAIHEIGHLMGATHTNGLGLMATYTDQIQCTDSYAPDSIAQIMDYVQYLP